MAKDIKVSIQSHEICGHKRDKASKKKKGNITDQIKSFMDAPVNYKIQQITFPLHSEHDAVDLNCWGLNKLSSIFI